MEREGGLYLLGTPETEKERTRLRLTGLGRFGGRMERRRDVAAIVRAMRRVRRVARMIGRSIVKAV